MTLQIGNLYQSVKVIPAELKLTVPFGVGEKIISVNLEIIQQPIDIPLFRNIVLQQIGNLYLPVIIILVVLKPTVLFGVGDIIIMVNLEITQLTINMFQPKKKPVIPTGSQFQQDKITPAEQEQTIHFTVGEIIVMENWELKV